MNSIRCIVFALATTGAVSAAHADDAAERAFRALNGWEQSQVIALERNGYSNGYPEHLVAIAIARSGGRNGAERERVRALSVGATGVTTSRAEQIGTLIRHGGANGAQRASVEAARRGGAAGGRDVERIAGKIRGGRYRGR